MAVVNMGYDQPPKKFKFEHTLSFSPPTTPAASLGPSPTIDDFSSSGRKVSSSTSPTSPDNTTNNESTQHDVGFSFVNVGHPSEARGSTNKRAIRSHVAKVQHSKVRLSASVNKNSTAKARSNTRPIHPRPDADTIDILIEPGRNSKTRVRVNITVDTANQARQNTQVGSSPDCPSGDTKPRQDSHFSAKALESTHLDSYKSEEEHMEDDTSDSDPIKQEPVTDPGVLQLVRTLRGGRHDPFWTYPIPFHSHLERIIDHCRKQVGQCSIAHVLTTSQT